MTLTDRDRKILIAIVPVVVLVAYWFLLLAPKREEVSTAKADLATQQQRVETARAAANAAQGAKQDFDASYAQVVRLGKAIPSTVDMPSLLVQLDAAAAGTGIRFTKIATGDRVPGATATPAQTTTPPAAGSESGTTGTPAAAGGETAQSQPGAAAEAANNTQQTANQNTAAAEQSGVQPSDTQTSTSAGATTENGDAAATAPPGLETVPLELEFEGDFFNLADFFHDVKRFVSLANGDVLVSGRLLTVEKVKWSSDEEIFPHIKAEITATIYLSPKAQGVTAGATPQGPATGTPASGTTPAPSEPAVAPAATATP
jgi:Tfp pilus assembly protein PilO